MLRRLLLMLAGLIVLGMPAASSAAVSCPNEAIRITQHATYLPDCRAYELVSPPDKHGIDVMANAARVHAAREETPSDPMAATFSALGGFADVHGSDAAADYMAIRTGTPGTPGWVTHGITPPEQPLSFFEGLNGFQSQWEAEFSPELSRGVFRSASPQTEEPNVADLENLYYRGDLRTPGVGEYHLVTNCPACESPLLGVPRDAFVARFAGASADFSHVIFESGEPLVAGSTAHPQNPNLFESVDGELRLAGILPDSACESPPCIAPASVAGSGVGGAFGAGYTSPQHTISADGSRIIFTDISSADGGNEVNSGALYMRVNGTSTVQLNASEKSSPDASQPATYQDASVDGSRVFFTSDEQLTDTPTNGSGDLYMYDVNAAAGHHLTLISADHEPADVPNGIQGVMGASADGHTVYFIDSGQLVAGAPVLQDGRGVYEWTDRDGGGRTFYIGQLTVTGDVSSDILPNFWGSSPNEVRVTPDGGHLLFVSSSGDGLTGYPSAGHSELYLYSADSGRLRCVSCRPDGTPAGGDATVMSEAADTGASGNTSHRSNPVTDDGSKVFFTTTDSLVPSDVNGKSDAYEFDTATDELHLLSSGTENAKSYFMDASANGDDVFFLTRQRLVGWDSDSNVDLYDARVGGGLPEPAASTGCVGDPCQGALAGPPGESNPGTTSFVGAGNLASRPAGGSPKPASGRPSRARLLGKALKQCRRKHGRHRRRCEVAARKRYAKKGGVR